MPVDDRRALRPDGGRGKWGGEQPRRSSTSPADSSRASVVTSLRPSQQGRRESNSSVQRRERNLVWGRCLREVQVLRRGGSWQEVRRVQATKGSDFAGGACQGARAESNEVTSCDGVDSIDAAAKTAASRRGQHVDPQLHANLDVLASLAYPNSSISPQDAGLMLSALCEAAGPSSDSVDGRIARLYVMLCAKQQKIAFSAWQLTIVVEFFIGCLQSDAGASPHATSPAGVRSIPADCVRALAQLMYENGERLGTRFDDILPPILGLAVSAAADLEARHAALDAVANLCLKNWTGLSEPQQRQLCSCLTNTFIAHWRTAGTPVLTSAGPKGTNSCTAGERKILASAERGLALAVRKGGVSAVLGPNLARIVHALNHLVQPAGQDKRPARSFRRDASGGGNGSGGGSASRSWSHGRSSGGYGGTSPTRALGSGGSACLADPRARIRLQALSLLEAMASKDAKSLHQYWPLFFAPDSVAEGAAMREGSSPVLPAGLVAIMEGDDAPQIRAAAAGAAASLVKNAPLRKWMSSAVAAPAVTGVGGGGIGQRSESMMLHLQRRLVRCLAQEKSPAVLAKVCACAGALMGEMPYAGATSEAGSSLSVINGAAATSTSSDLLEESLAKLLAALTELMLDSSAEPNARASASQALTAALSTKEPLTAVHTLLQTFCGGKASRNRSWTPKRRVPSSPGASRERNEHIWSPLPVRAGTAGDRSNRFAQGSDSRSSGGSSANEPSTVRRRGGDADANDVDEEGVAASGAGPQRTPQTRCERKAIELLHGEAANPQPPSPQPAAVAGEGGTSFVGCLIALADAPGQLRAEALALLARVARSYHTHLVGTRADANESRSIHGAQHTWERASGLLLRCFADTDQNLRLHALKVLEALLQARAARDTKIPTTTAMPCRINIFAVDCPSRRSEGAGEPAGVSDDAPGGSPSTSREAGSEGDTLLGDLIQKHLQRALEDPYHGVRAVACSCHTSLLASDWDLFPEAEREQRLTKLLGATRDRAAGVNTLACRVIAGLMATAGQEGTAAWCRAPAFLERCAARLEDMMHDRKDTTRAQATLAVGNLACSLRSIRLRSVAGADEGSPEWSSRGTYSEPMSARDTITSARVRSLCERVVHLTASEPDHAAGSAARAVGYLAWALGAGSRGGDDREQSASQGAQAGSADASAVINGNDGSEQESGDPLRKRAVLELTKKLALGGEDRAPEANVQAGTGTGLDRKAEATAAKCRWNCCIALGLILSTPDVTGEAFLTAIVSPCLRRDDANQAATLPASTSRLTAAEHLPVRRHVSPSPIHLILASERVMLEDKHLKVRTYAALALKATPMTRMRGQELEATLGSAVRALHACRTDVNVIHPAQMRFAAPLEDAIRSLILHLLVDLVLGGVVSLNGIPRPHPSVHGTPPRRRLGAGHDGNRPPWSRQPACRGQAVCDGRDSAGRDNGGGRGAESALSDRAKAMLVLEYASELLDVLASADACSRQSRSDLARYRQRIPEELVVLGGLRIAKASGASACEYLMATAVAEAVLCTTSEELVRVLGVVDKEKSDCKESLVSKHNWHSFGSEAARRRQLLEKLGRRAKMEGPPGEISFATGDATASLSEEQQDEI